MFMHWQIKKVVMVKFDLNLDLTLSLDVMWQRNWYKGKDRMSMLARENQWCVARRQSWLSELCSLPIITWILRGRSYRQITTWKHLIMWDIIIRVENQDLHWVGLDALERNIAEAMSCGSHTGYAGCMTWLDNVVWVTYEVCRSHDVTGQCMRVA